MSELGLSGGTLDGLAGAVTSGAAVAKPEIDIKSRK
jgi:hypothetical protein